MIRRFAANTMDLEKKDFSRVFMKMSRPYIETKREFHLENIGFLQQEKYQTRTSFKHFQGISSSRLEGSRFPTRWKEFLEIGSL
jgi:hypothetical protein